MTPAQKALFTEYEELKRTIVELDEKCEELKPQLITLIPEDATIDTGTGTFTLSSRKVWKFSENCQRLEAELKTVKETEQQTGIAEAVDGEPFIVFKQKKA
jgi:regulator of replication initiation timing